jgi:O-antigen ligase
MIFVITVWASVDARRATRLLKAIAVFSTLIAAYGLFAFDTGVNLFLGDAVRPGAVTATFINRNHYATYAIFGALANLAAYLHVSQGQADTPRGRIEGFFAGAWVYALGLLLCIGAASLTQSRAGGVAGLIGLAAFLLAWRQRRATAWETAMLMLPLAFLVFVAVTSGSALTQRLLSTSAEDARFSVFPAVVEAISDRPLLGHGLGAFEEAFRPYLPQDASEFDWNFAHNTYLELAFGLGLVGATAFFAVLLAIVLRIYRGARRRHNNRVYACLGLGCAAAAGFHAIFDFSLQMPAVAALFAVILGLAYAQSFTSAELASGREGASWGAARRTKPAGEPAERTKVA